MLQCIQFRETEKTKLWVQTEDNEIWKNNRQPSLAGTHRDKEKIEQKTKEKEQKNKRNHPRDGSLSTSDSAKAIGGGRKGLRWRGFALFLVRFCGNFYFNLRYCGFKTLSGLRLLQPLGRGFRWKKSLRWWHSLERSASAGLFAYDL